MTFQNAIATQKITGWYLPWAFILLWMSEQNLEEADTHERRLARQSPFLRTPQGPHANRPLIVARGTPRPATPMESNESKPPRSLTSPPIGSSHAAHQPSRTSPRPLPYSQPPAVPPSPPISSRTLPQTPPSEQTPAAILPLREVARPEGLVGFHVPFSLQDSSAIEKRLGSFSADPTQYIKEFQYLAQAFSLTWYEIHVILTSTLTPEERERIQAAAREHADQTHMTAPTMPVGADAVPAADPNWNYQHAGNGHRRRDQIIPCLLAGMRATSTKSVNFNKLQEIIQDPNENPAAFLSRLTEALTQYTRLDPTTPAGATVLATYFISQSAPDIQKKP
ncbi:uncharacterized protein LOC113599748 [Acinonyx jubatus]|uniref:Uncharacterized protein LOC113599748 n=1 Tax=Acinonyx jubatus TaxID=32536 RepID=A0ABM3Q1R4_ACIJB|nr:uncharacterized protein LOC113599748 [Acinonyx jubatus]